MANEQIFARYSAGGYPAAVAEASPRAGEQFYLALLAFGANELVAAHEHAAAAATQQPDQPLYTAAAEYLGRVKGGGREAVYADPAAFTAFIRGGGNTGLYAATSAALREAYQQDRARSLLDIGTGDGLALLPALADTIEQLDVVEPSRALLDATAQQLNARGRTFRAFNGSLQEFVARVDGQWDVVQATFSLQSIAPEARPPLLAWLRARARRLLIAEFDVPTFREQFAPERAAYVASRFAQGLAEYAGDNGLVAQGFLMPVMFGYFDRTAARTNYEHPIGEWAAQLRAAGFGSVATRLLYPYWWAPACLIDARPA